MSWGEEIGERGEWRSARVLGALSERGFCKGGELNTLKGVLKTA